MKHVFDVQDSNQRPFCYSANHSSTALLFQTLLGAVSTPLINFLTMRKAPLSPLGLLLGDNNNNHHLEIKPCFIKNHWVEILLSFPGFLFPLFGYESYSITQPSRGWGRYYIHSYIMLNEWRRKQELQYPPLSPYKPASRVEYEEEKLDGRLRSCLLIRVLEAFFGVFFKVFSFRRTPETIRRVKKKKMKQKKKKKKKKKNMAHCHA